ncbi:MAG: hypothetical protein WB711_01185 [Terriglobales bacterium]
MKKLYRKLSLLLALVLVLIPASWVWAQSPAQPPQTSPATAATPHNPEPGQDKKTAPADADKPEQKISPKEAEELFRDVDQIMQFASKETGLPIKKEVKRRLVSRDEVVAYLQKNMAEDKDAQRLRRSELVLKKFGLLPRDFDLQTFLVALLREQVAGYYDIKTKTVNLLDWIDSEQQRPVLAHELTHALQDQSFGLEKWMKVGDTDLNDKKETTPADIENDEISEARQAVVEGQAMVVLVDYLLAPTGQSIVSSPQIADALKEAMLVGSADSPEFKDAPIFLKEELTFPYRYGLDFETELLRTGGKEKAFASAFANPPRTTRQIMEPKTYLSGERLDPMRVPDFQHDFKNYERFDVGAIGEFDVAVLLDQYASTEVSRNLYPHWRGGYYYAARPKGEPTAPLSLLYVSRWSSPEKASAFAAIYAQSLAKRYKHVNEVTEDEQQVSTNPKKPEALPGTRTWMTEEGAVVIDVEGDCVLITESLDQATTERLRQELFGTFVADGK